MKLTIEHIQGYAAYGLKMQNTKSGRIIDVRGIEIGVDSFTILATVKDGQLFKDVSYQSDLWPLKPLLRPLSDLTEEEWMQVFKAGFDNSAFDHSTQFSKIVAKIDDSVSVLYRGTVIRFIKSELSFHHWPIKFNQLLAFREIYKLHGDIEGLIEQGLAIKK